MEIRLELENHGFLDISKDVPLAITFDINDVRNISSRNGAWSKTIKLPGTNHNNTVLGNIFDVNVQTLTFNPNLKVNVRISVDGLDSFEGVFQIRKINKNFKNSEDMGVTYDAYIKSDTSSFYSDISGKYLTDLDLSEFDHTWALADVQDNMASANWTDGIQYYLTYVDNPYANYEARDLIPAVYARTYWDHIFTDAGYTYEFDEASDIKFNRLIIPYNGDIYKPFSDESLKIKAFFDGVYPTYTNICDIVPDADPFDPAAITVYDNDIIFTSDVDPSDLYSIVTGQLDVSNLSGSMELRTRYDASLTLNIDDFTPLYPSVSIGVNATFIIGIRNRFIVRDSSGNDLGILSSTTLFEETLDNNYTTSSRVNLLANSAVDANAIYNSDIYPTADHIVNVLQVSAAGNSAFVGFVGFSSTDNYGADFEVSITSDGLFENVPDTYLTASGAVTMSKLIPKKIKQSDFVLALIKMHNLYLTPDEYNPTNIIIKTRDKFYADGIELDWTDKVERTSIDVELISNTQSKNKTFSYKADDKDIVSEAYIEQTNEIYGQLDYVFENEFIKGVELVEPIFSPTFITTSSDQNNIVPLIDSRSPKNNIRILYAGDVLSKYWQFYNGAGNIASNFTGINDYRYAGHLFPNISAPEYDLNFGVCDYYSHSGPIIDNNLYNQHYHDQMDIFNNGHILTASFKLSKPDVSNLKFNERIFVYDSWYHINKILDFDLNNNKLTKVELITADLTNGTFVPNFNIVGNESRPTQFNGAKNDMPGNNIFGGVTNVSVEGSGNVIQSGSTGTFIGGYYNNVGGSNSLVLGDFNTVLGDGIAVLGINGGTFTTPGTYFGSPIIQYVNFIDAGRGEVLGEFPGNKIVNFIDAGRGVIRGLGSESPETNIDAGRGTV